MNPSGVQPFRIWGRCKPSLTVDLSLAYPAIYSATLDINNTYFTNGVTSYDYTTPYGQTIRVEFSAIQARNANYIEIGRYETMTVSGVDMTQITVTFSDSNHALVNDTSPGTWNSPNWTGSSDSVEFEGGRAGNVLNRRYCQFRKLQITYLED